MANIKNICILGSTGSIGKNSLDVISNFPDRFHSAYLTTNKNIDLLEQQVLRFRPKGVAILDEESSSIFKRRMNGSLKIFSGEQGLLDLVGAEDFDVVINSLVGFVGLKPTIDAIKRGKTVALANKETLVVAGEIITKLVRQHNARLIPIDSEHSAILQCLAGEKMETIARLILTASGGPFLHLDKKEFVRVTIEDALKHPNWKMGSKITIDSATMMNKGLEIIEAHWLFNLPAEKIEVLIHPQSIIHSMVEFIDGSVKAQLGIPDMKIPIQYALTYPERALSQYSRVDFAGLRSMTFLEPDRVKFECIELAYQALRASGTAPVVLNAANEVAVDLFLHGKITFDLIPTLIRYVLETLPAKPVLSIEHIISVDSAARKATLDYHEHSRRSPQVIMS